MEIQRVPNSSGEEDGVLPITGSVCLIKSLEWFIYPEERFS